MKSTSPPLILFAVLISAALFVSCASSSKSKRSDPGPQRDYLAAPGDLPDSEKAHYQKIRELYNARSYKQAQDQAQSFYKKYPKSRVISYVYNLHGLIALQFEQNLQSIHWFKKAVESNQDPEFQPFVFYNLASAQYEAKQYEPCLDSLNRVNSQLLNPDTQVKYHYLRGVVLNKMGDPFQAANQLFTSSHLIPDSQNADPTKNKTKTLFQNQINEALGNLGNPVQLEALLSNHEDTVFTDLLLYRLGKYHSQHGRTASAEKHFREIVNRYPDSEHVPEAIEYLRKQNFQSIVNPRSVGVLFPMTGRFAKIGAKSIRSIELALGIFGAEPGQDSKITLVVEDAGETPEQAAEALKKLYYDHHVVAAIGPLLSKGIKEITEKANQLGLPLISLAQQSGIPGEYSFYISPTSKMQADQIAEFAYQKLGLRRFGILYPNDNFGNEYMTHFWNKVDELGGQVVALENYPSAETDFRTYIDKMSGLYYMDARQKEIEEMSKEREKLGIKRKTQKNQQLFQLPPIVDYEAVFVPDESRALSQILPTFAYRDVDTIKFLGITTWNSTALAKQNPDLSELAFFTHFYSDTNLSPIAQSFKRKFMETFGEAPSSLDALAYDAARLLEHALLAQGNSSPSRDTIRETLSKISQFPGVTGRLTFENSHFDRDLQILKFSKGHVVENATDKP